MNNVLCMAKCTINHLCTLHKLSSPHLRCLPRLIPFNDARRQMTERWRNDLTFWWVCRLGWRNSTLLESWVIAWGWLSSHSHTFAVAVGTVPMPFTRTSRANNHLGYLDVHVVLALDHPGICTLREVCTAVSIRAENDLLHRYRAHAEQCGMSEGRLVSYGHVGYGAYLRRCHI
jgi:hypothetical protein